MNQEKARDVFDLTIKQNRCIEKLSSRCNIFSAVLFLLLFVAAVPLVSAESIVYPSGSGVINVTDAAYGAVPNDGVDDTVAIQAALDAARPTGTNRFLGRTVYFPNGVYNVSDRLAMTDRSDHQSMTLQGQSQAGVVIRLNDNNPNYQDSASRKAVLASWIKGPDSPLTFQNSAFNINIHNLTVDVGVGNPGAMGITYIASNQGSLRDVTIKSSDAIGKGFVGLNLQYVEGGQGLPGPALVKNVTINGFDYGIRIYEQQYSMVFEHVTLRRQRTAGIYNAAATLTFRKLTSENIVPAIRQVANNDTNGMITIIDSDLRTPANTTSASKALDIADGFLFARNVQTSGYAAAINDRGTSVAGAVIGEYKTGDGAASLFQSPARSLNLEIKETPEVAWDNPTQKCLPSPVQCAVGTWASVTDFGAVQGDDTVDNSAIQAAIDSGATTVIFPNTATTSGTGYLIRGGAISVRGNVRRMIGMYTNLKMPGSGVGFRVVSGTQPVVMIEGFQVNTRGTGPSSAYLIEQASARTLVLRNLSTRRGYGYKNSGFGDVFIEDFHSIALDSPIEERDVTPAFSFKNQRVWARQLNPEISNPEVLNDGATAWILGLKTEDVLTLVETKNNGRTEVLGGFTITGATPVATVPAFINNESQVSIVHAEGRTSQTRGHFPIIVRETRNGVTRELSKNDLQYVRKTEADASLPTDKMKASYIIPLYTGYTRTTPADFDGDGRTDISIFRPAASVWHLLASGNNFAYSGVQFGISTDKLAPADYDGDGKTDVALYRPSSGTWYVQQSGAGFRAVQWGVSSDKPIPADFDGDGRADYTVYRPSTGQWYIYRSSDNTVRITQFGLAEDVPVVGDYDGDGRADMAVWRPSTSVWYVQQSGAGFVAQQFGLSSDKPVAADYDADGKTDIAVWRPSSGTWYMQKSTEGFGTVQFGISSDVATPGDYDGDGRADIAVWRPSTGVWYMEQSRDGFAAQQFGVSSDKPAPAAFIR